jgi:hypothetical protein
LVSSSISIRKAAVVVSDVGEVPEVRVPPTVTVVLLGLVGLSAFGGDAVCPVVGSGTPTYRHHRRALPAASSTTTSGTGSSPVGVHKLGNNSAEPGVVTYVSPDGEVQMTVPSGIVSETQVQSVGRWPWVPEGDEPAGTA